MNIQNFTQKRIEAIGNARTLMAENSNQQLEQEHLFYVLLDKQDGLAGELMSNIGVSVQSLKEDLDDAISKLPKVTTSSEADKIYVSHDMDAALAEAEAQAKKMQDDFVSVEHIILGLLMKPSRVMKDILHKHSITNDKLLSALKNIRGNRRVSSDNPEDTYDVLKKYGQDLVELARNHKLDPVIGRDDEIRNVIRILSRKTKKQPLSYR